ncbi:hypothetical protein EMIT0P218_20406 [Pseudomonas sp. IT-P218]
MDAVNFILGFIPSNVETLFIQMPRVIVNDHREQARSHRGMRSTVGASLLAMISRSPRSPYKPLYSS